MEEVVRRGYLVKWPFPNKGLLSLGSARRRYFILKPNKLEYYVDEDAYRQSKEPRGVVVIRPDLVIQPKVGDTRGFVMVLEGQELRLQAENDREAQEWMESIRGRAVALKASDLSSLLVVGSSSSSSSITTEGLIKQLSIEDPQQTLEVAVVGASGAVGTATLDHLCKRLEGTTGVAEVYAVTRDVERLDYLSSIPGFKVVEGDMGQPTSLEETFKLVKCVMIVTPGCEERASLTINTINQAKACGVRFILLLSMCLADLPNTTFGGGFAEIEKAIKACEIPCTILRCPLFMDNFMNLRLNICHSSLLVSPIHPEKAYSAITVSDVGKAAAEVLLSPSSHAMKTYRITAHPFTQSQLTAAFTKALLRPIAYEHTTYKQARASMFSSGFWEWSVQGILEIYQLIDAESPITLWNTNDYQTITGCQPTTYEEWVNAHAAAFPKLEPPPRSPVHSMVRALSPFTVSPGDPSTSPRTSLRLSPINLIEAIESFTLRSPRNRNKNHEDKTPPEQPQEPPTQPSSSPPTAVNKIAPPPPITTSTTTTEEGDIKKQWSFAVEQSSPTEATALAQVAANKMLKEGGDYSRAVDGAGPVMASPQVPVVSTAQKACCNVM